MNITTALRRRDAGRTFVAAHVAADGRRGDGAAMDSLKKISRGTTVARGYGGPPSAGSTDALRTDAFAGEFEDVGQFDRAAREIAADPGDDDRVRAVRAHAQRIEAMHVFFAGVAEPVPDRGNAPVRVRLVRHRRVRGEALGQAAAVGAVADGEVGGDRVGSLAPKGSVPPR